MLMCFEKVKQIQLDTQMINYLRTEGKLSSLIINDGWPIPVKHVIDYPNNKKQNIGNKKNLKTRKRKLIRLSIFINSVLLRSNIN